MKGYRSKNGATEPFQAFVMRMESKILDINQSSRRIGVGWKCLDAIGRREEGGAGSIPDWFD